MRDDVQTATFEAVQVPHPCGKTDADFSSTANPHQLACAGCTTPVNNLSAMMLKEVKAMLREPGGHCVRYTTDSMGRIRLAPSKRTGAQRWLAPTALSLAATAAGCESRQAEPPPLQEEAIVAPPPVRLPHVMRKEEQAPRLPASEKEAELSIDRLAELATTRSVEGTCAGYCNGFDNDRNWDRPAKRKRRHRKVRVDSVDLPGAATVSHPQGQTDDLEP